jgi:hypothetical protein
MSATQHELQYLVRNAKAYKVEPEYIKEKLHGLLNKYKD